MWKLVGPSSVVENENTFHVDQEKSSKDLLVLSNKFTSYEIDVKFGYVFKVCEKEKKAVSNELAIKLIKDQIFVVFYEPNEIIAAFNSEFGFPVAETFQEEDQGFRLRLQSDHLLIPRGFREIPEKQVYELPRMNQLLRVATAGIQYWDGPKELIMFDPTCERFYYVEGIRENEMGERFGAVLEIPDGNLRILVNTNMYRLYEPTEVKDGVQHYNFLYGPNLTIASNEYWSKFANKTYNCNHWKTIGWVIF